MNENRPAARILMFPGVTELPVTAPAQPALPPLHATSVKALYRTALRLGVRDLVVIGNMPDGELYVGSQSEDLTHVVGVLSRAVTWMTLPEDPEWIEAEEDGPPSA